MLQYGIHQMFIVLVRQLFAKRRTVQIDHHHGVVAGGTDEIGQALLQVGQRNQILVIGA